MSRFAVRRFLKYFLGCGVRLFADGSTSFEQLVKCLGVIEKKTVVDHPGVVVPEGFLSFTHWRQPQLAVYRCFVVNRRSIGGFCSKGSFAGSVLYCAATCRRLTKRGSIEPLNRFRPVLAVTITSRSSPRQARDREHAGVLTSAGSIRFEADALTLHDIAALTIGRRSGQRASAP